MRKVIEGGGDGCEEGSIKERGCEGGGDGCEGGGEGKW